jgi:hypothetical protein
MRFGFSSASRITLEILRPASDYTNHVSNPTARLVETQICSRNAGAEPQPADAGGRIKPGVERKARNPRNSAHQKPSSPRMRATAIEEELWLSRSQT